MKHEKIGIGEILKKEREKRGLSLSDIARETLIREFYLEQIENDDFPRYDGYIAAYIRKYAEALGIDPEPLVKKYKELFPEEVHPELTNEEKVKAKSPFVISVVIVIAILSLTAIFTYAHLKRPSIPANNNNNTETPVQENKPSENKPPVSEQTSSEKKNSGGEEQKKQEGIKVTVTVDAKCWLGVTIDGKYTQVMLYKGQSKTFVGKKYIKILYGNAMHAYVTVNGKDEGVVSKNKKVVEVEYKAP